MAAANLSSREWRIVEALFRLMPENPKMVNYEDVVVKAWELYPDEFGLRGYSERYPDASDVHKPLYNTLKARGWVKTGPRGQKKFTLTDAGWESASGRFASGAAQLEMGEGRLSRSTQQELRHLEGTTAAALFHDRNADDILDTDFFAFYRTSVRAPAKEFAGRLAQVRTALEEGAEKGHPLASPLADVDAFLRDRFSEIIQAKQG